MNWRPVWVPVTHHRSPSPNDAYSLQPKWSVVKSICARPKTRLKTVLDWHHELLVWEGLPCLASMGIWIIAPRLKRFK